MVAVTSHHHVPAKLTQPYIYHKQANRSLALIFHLNFFLALSAEVGVRGGGGSKYLYFQKELAPTGPV